MTDDVRTGRLVYVGGIQRVLVPGPLSPSANKRSPIMDFANLKRPDAVDLRLAWMFREALALPV